MSCKHEELTYEPSSHAAAVGWPRRTSKQLYKAAGEEASLASPPNITRLPKAQYLAFQSAQRPRGPRPPYGGTFPAPLVFPGDELAYDPKYPPQSYHAWLKEKERNAVERQKGGRNVVYVVAPPKMEEDLEELMEGWATPKLPRKKSKASGSAPQATTPTPEIDDVVDYLAAFYHGMSVKQLPDTGKTELTFAKWEDGELEEVPPQKSRKTGAKTKAKATAATRTPPAIALKTSSEAIRIRVRERRNDLYSTQLNLNDLLDVAIEILPKDAYALLMLVEQDLYEDDDDDFACGRAYGGSRVGVVSMARYNPDADEVQSIDREHAWPASHCKDFVEEYSGESPRKAKTKDPSAMTEEELDAYLTPNALQSAVGAYVSCENVLNPDMDRRKADKTLWLGRVCRTASHELGHCFGIDHCIYYACAIQGTASIQEDARQPPYLCPVDLAKVCHATGADMEWRYKILSRFCDKHGGSFFDSFSRWIGVRLTETTSQMLGTSLRPEGDMNEAKDKEDDSDNENTKAKASQVEVIDLTTPPRKQFELRRNGK